MASTNLALPAMMFMTVGVSMEAQALQSEPSLKGGSVSGEANPVSYRSVLDELAPELVELWDECHLDDWDGYGARGLRSSAMERALDFLQVFPTSLPAPELSAMPNGDLALDWDFSPRRTLTLTISARPRLVYAAIEGDEEWSGTVSFLSEIPRSLLDTLTRLSQ